MSPEKSEVNMMNRAEVLLEAMPYIQQFHGAFVVIKYGGNAMLNEEAKEWTVRDTILLRYVGMKPIIVHGGGPEISLAMEKMGKKPEFIEGLRVTDEETLEIAKMVLVGKINTDIVTKIDRFGARGVGLSGKDGRLLFARKKAPQKVVSGGVEREVDLGLVGETEEVSPEILETLTEKGYIPVISPIAVGKDGSSLNVNSDTVAGDIASAMKAKKLIVLTDVPGVLKDLKDEKSIIKRLSTSEGKKLMKEGKIGGSMIPKLQACINAVEGGVEKAHIIDGRVKHSILLELFTDEGIGTMISGA